MHAILTHKLALLLTAGVLGAGAVAGTSITTTHHGQTQQTQSTQSAQRQQAAQSSIRRAARLSAWLKASTAWTTLSNTLEPLTHPDTATMDDYQLAITDAAALKTAFVGLRPYLTAAQRAIVDQHLGPFLDNLSEAGAVGANGDYPAATGRLMIAMPHIAPLRDLLATGISTS